MAQFTEEEEQREERTMNRWEESDRKTWDKSIIKIRWGASMRRKETEGWALPNKMLLQKWWQNSDIFHKWWRSEGFWGWGATTTDPQRDYTINKQLCVRARTLLILKTFKELWRTIRRKTSLKPSEFYFDVRKCFCQSLLQFQAAGCLSSEGKPLSMHWEDDATVCVVGGAGCVTH